MGRPKIVDLDKIKDCTYKVRLTREDKRKLDELSQYLGYTKADVFRILINDAYELVFNTSYKEWIEDLLKEMPNSDKEET